MWVHKGLDILQTGSSSRRVLELHLGSGHWPNSSALDSAYLPEKSSHPTPYALSMASPVSWCHHNPPGLPGCSLLCSFQP